MKTNKKSFFLVLYHFFMILLKIITRSFKTSYLITYTFCVIAVLQIYYISKNRQDTPESPIESLLAMDSISGYYKRLPLIFQTRYFDSYETSFPSVSSVPTQPKSGFTYLANIPASSYTNSISFSNIEPYKLFDLYQDQTGTDPFTIFSGGVIEHTNGYMTGITNFINAFFTMDMEKLGMSLEDFEDKINFSDTAFLHNRYISHILNLKNNRVYFARRTLPKSLKNGLFVLFISMIVSFYALIISGNVSFYKDLLTSKITSFLNIIGYPLFTQWITIHLVSFILTFPLTCLFGILLQRLLSETEEIIIHEILMNITNLIHVQFILNCITLSLYKLLPAFFTNMANMISGIIFITMSFIPIPIESGIFYKIIYYSSPVNAMTYFLWFQTRTDNRGFKALKYFTLEFKNTTLLSVSFIQLGVTILVALISFLLYKMDHGILDIVYTTLNKTAKKVYNLIYRKKNKADNGKIIKTNVKVNVEQTKDKLVIQKLSKYYTTFGDKFKALQDINLQLNKGGKIALLGHNGCGKTTFLDTLIGLLKRSSGVIYLDGSKINNSTDLQSKLGYCPQFTKTIPSFNVQENLDLVSSLYNIPKTESDAILSDLDLLSHKYKSVETLSGGQKRKLGLAMAIISSAKLIILDEPTTGIDVLYRKIIFKIIRKYSKDSIVIFSTHLIEEAENYADKVAILSQGNLMAFDTVIKIKRKFNIVYNRLRINFLDKVNHNFIDKLKEIFDLNVVNETDKTINLEIKETNYNTLATLYDHMEEFKHSYNVESYGVYKASLEEVLNLQEFRELKTINGTSKDGKKQDGFILNLPTQNLTKKITPFSTIKALFYHNFISFISDYKSILYLLITSICVLFFSNRSRVISSYNNKNNDKNYNPFPTNSFKRLLFNNKAFQINDKKKVNFMTFDLKLNKSNELVKFIKEESSMKASVNILETSSTRINEIFEDDDAKNMNKQQGEFTRYYDETAAKIRHLLGSSNYDLFILEIEYGYYKLIFDLYFEEDRPKDGTDYDEYQKKMEIKNKNRVMVIIQKNNDDPFPILFNFLQTEYYLKKHLNIKDEVKQEIILNKDYLNINKEFELAQTTKIFMFMVIILITSLISDKLIDDKESGIYTLWTINGVTRVVVYLFNIIFYSFFIFTILSLPTIFANTIYYRSIASLLMKYYLTYLLLIIIMLGTLFSLCSHFLSKTAITTITNGTISLTFGVLLAKPALSVFIETDKLQKYLFYNPVYLLYVFIGFLMNGEINPLNKEHYYFFARFGINSIYLGNWAMANYIKTYFIPVLTIETGIFMITTIIAVFKIFTLLNEAIKRYEFKSLKAKINIDNKSNNNIINSESLDKKVVLKNVTKIYGHKCLFNFNYALQNFNLTASSGDSIGVLGANGGGKTTAFKLLTKELETTFGDIQLNNKRLSNIKTGYMGYVPQYEALPSNMTPYQVLKFYAHLYNWKGQKTEDYIQNILLLMKLRKNKYKKISSLSGGNKRKVVLAISILLNKDFLVLDEPTTGIDITNCQDIWNVVQEKTKDKTILLASHSTRESEQLTNKIIILIKGKIVASGSKESIREQHGKYFEVEIELYENDEKLENNMEMLKEQINKYYNQVRFDIKNNFKISCYIEKRQLKISTLIRNFAEWKPLFNINEFFINESTLEDILRDKLEERNL